MKVKIADWIAQYLVDQGIKYNFTVPGAFECFIWSSGGTYKYFCPA